MQIEVTPVQGTANQFTVTLAQYRLAFSGTQDAALEVADALRKQINRSSGRKPKVVDTPTNLLDTLSV
jgi:hypothetical protein